MAGVSDWHKKQRKKEQQKNKATRIAARDERVKTEKDERAVQREIQELEEKYPDTDDVARPHMIKVKLDRLRKELKIVVEEAKKKPVKRSYAPQRKFQPLAEPTMSVYYDVALNPYGEPPPGMPRMFHRRGGGTTLDIRDACVPGRENDPPPPRPPSHKSRASESNRKETSQVPHSNQQYGTQSTESTQQLVQQKVEAKPTETKPMAQDIPADIHATTTKKKSTTIPALPPPSAAVERSKKKLAVDIWASTEEIEYEEAVGIGSCLEDSNKTSVDGNNWYYRDTAGTVQGPYHKDQLGQWIQAGYFPMRTSVSSGKEGPWRPMGQVKALRVLASGPVGSKNKTGSNASANKKSSVADRIAALKQERLQETAAQVQPDPQAADRIAALRKERLQEITPPAQVADRIAALRKERLQEMLLRTQHEKSTNQNEVDRNSIAENHPVDNGEVGPQPDLVAPYPLPDETPDVPAYPLDPEVVAPYSVGDEDVVPAYPVGDVNTGAVAAYPTGDDDAEGGEYGVTGEYPITGTDGSTSNEEPKVGQQASLKRTKVDQDLVAFRPQKLRKKTR